MAINKSLLLALGLVALVNGAQAELAPDFDPKQHFSKMDPNTGYPIGESLYQLKANELGDIIRQARLNVESRPKPLFENFYTGDGTPPVPSKTQQIADEVESLVIARNKALIEKMNSLELPRASLTQVAQLTKPQLVETAKSILYTPANDARPALKNKYDPKGSYGFCFLRAHYYAMTALSRGLDRDSVRKVFLVGKMMPLGIIPVGVWQFHVATAVRGPEGVWYVLDNHMGVNKAYTVLEWYNYYRSFLDTKDKYSVKMTDGGVEESASKALFLYFTDPMKIGASSNAYNKEGFYGQDTNNDGTLSDEEAFYNRIFEDVDALFMTKRADGSSVFRTLPFCSKERYKSLAAQSERCQKPEMQEAVQVREKLVQSWKDAYWKEEMNRLAEEHQR